MKFQFVPFHIPVATRFMHAKARPISGGLAAQAARLMGRTLKAWALSYSALPFKGVLAAQQNPGPWMLAWGNDRV